jgi:protein disulfide-isomerase A1
MSLSSSTLLGECQPSFLSGPSKDNIRCGHCKRLKPTWDALGEHYAAVKDRIIMYVVFLPSCSISYGFPSAKIDATENDLPQTLPFRVGGFPTLKLKPAGAKDWIDYDGERSLEGLIAFVDEHATNSLVPLAKDESTDSQHPIELDHDEL